MPTQWNDTWVVTVDELVPRFYNKYRTLQSEVRCYRDKDYGIKQVQKGGNGREALYAFHTLRPDIQQAMGGDPATIKNHLEPLYSTDADAVAYYSKQFRFNDGTGLSLKHQDEYITNASVLKAAIALRAARQAMWRNLGRNGNKGMYATLLRDAIDFNNILKLKHDTVHTLPESEKYFKAALKAFENERGTGYNYASLISKSLRNQNRRIVKDYMLELLNDLFTDQAHKPTKTEIKQQYNAFVAGYVQVANPETGEMYNPKDFNKLSISTINGYLLKWGERTANSKMRSGNRQSFMGEFKPYHSFERPAFAGSIISVDDRQPPFKYSGNSRPWFYMGIDLASEAWVCWVHSKSKAGIAEDFYRQLVRNFHQWGLGVPAELEAELALNSAFAKGFLQPGRLFQHVHIEPNNARAKRIERYYKELRYTYEKTRAGWLARPNALSEANQASRYNSFTPSEEAQMSKAPTIPYEQIIKGCLQDIENWNNEPHKLHPEKTRWEVFMEMQHPNLKPICWEAILPSLGYKTETSCGSNAIIHLNNKEFLPGMNGEVSVGEPLINAMKIIGGRPIDCYWLDDNQGEVIRALVFLRGTDKMVCEAVAKPVYQRATIEMTDKDHRNRELMNQVVATLEGFYNRKIAERGSVVIMDNRKTTLNNKFRIDALRQDQGDALRQAQGDGLLQDQGALRQAQGDSEDAKIVRPIGEDEDADGQPVYKGLKSLRDRF